MKNTYKIPISVKGLILENGKVLLRQNERKEWELPGGKVDKGEQPEQTLIRELKEEVGLVCKAQYIVDARIITIAESIDETEGVMILIYMCKPIKKIGPLEVQSEGGKATFTFFLRDEVDNLNIDTIYKSAIKRVTRSTG